jgi:hypothetical protein
MSENGMLQRRSFTNVTKLNPGKNNNYENNFVTSATIPTW